MDNNITLSFISDEYVADRSVMESSVPDNNPSILRTISGPIAEWDALNRNKRKYSKKLWDRVLESDYVKEQLKYHTLFGEANHPSDRYEVDFSRVSHSITDMWEVPANNQIYGTINILNTPLGRVLNTLYEAGAVIGYSTRAGGTLNKRKDFVEVDENTYNFITLDAVPYPSVAAARPPVTEGVVSEVPLTEISESCHNELKNIICECSAQDKESVKNLIYSLRGYDFSKEKSLFEESKPLNINQSATAQSATMSLLKESSAIMENLKVENSTLKANLDKSVSENSQLKTTLNNSLQKITNLVEEARVLSEGKLSQESSFTNTIRELKESVEDLQNEKECLELEVEQLTTVSEAMKVVQSEKDSLQKDLQYQRKVVDESVSSRERDYENELTKAIMEINKLQDSQRELQDALSTAKGQLQVAESRLQETKDSIKLNESVLQNAESLETRCEKLQDMNELLKEEMTTITESVDKVNSQNRNLRRELVSVICSGYNVNEEEIYKSLPVGFTKSDIYLACESAHNASDREVTLVEGNSVASNQTTHMNSKANSWLYDKGFASNRRGLTIK